MMQRLSMRRLVDILHFRFSAVAADDAAVADLTAAFRIEAGRIEDDASLICDLIAFHAVFEQRDHLAFTAELIITDE